MMVFRGLDVEDVGRCGVYYFLGSWGGCLGLCTAWSWIVLFCGFRILVEKNLILVIREILGINQTFVELTGASTRFARQLHDRDSNSVWVKFFSVFYALFIIRVLFCFAW